MAQHPCNTQTDFHTSSSPAKPWRSQLPLPRHQGMLVVVRCLLLLLLVITIAVGTGLGTRVSYARQIPCAGSECGTSVTPTPKARGAEAPPKVEASGGKGGCSAETIAGSVPTAFAKYVACTLPGRKDEGGKWADEPSPDAYFTFGAVKPGLWTACGLTINMIDRNSGGTVTTIGLDCLKEARSSATHFHYAGFLPGQYKPAGPSSVYGTGEKLATGHSYYVRVRCYGKYAGHEFTGSFAYSPDLVLRGVAPASLQDIANAYAKSRQDIANGHANKQPLPGGYQADRMGLLLYIRLFQPTLWGYATQYTGGGKNFGWMTRQSQGEAAAFIKSYNVPVSSNVDDQNLRRFMFALTNVRPYAGSAFVPGTVCGESFTGTTAVATEQGEQQISQLSVGERVWAYDPATHTKELQPVTQVWINHDNDLMNVGLAPSPGTATETIHTTQDHLWLTTHGWVSSANLHPGDQVLRLDGRPATVTQLQVIPAAQDMYDLTVNQLHTFAVGENQYVVHNCTTEEAVIANELVKAWAQELNIDGRQTTLAVGFFTDPNTGETTLLGSLNSATMKSNPGLAAQLTSKLQGLDGTYVTTSQNPKAHAEINMLKSPEAVGKTLDGMSASNYFCYDCGKAAVDAAGGDTSVLGTGWKKAGVTRVKAGYKDPTQFEHIPELEIAPGGAVPEGREND